MVVVWNVVSFDSECNCLHNQKTHDTYLNKMTTQMCRTIFVQKWGRDLLSFSFISSITRLLCRGSLLIKNCWFLWRYGLVVSACHPRDCSYGSWDRIPQDIYRMVFLKLKKLDLRCFNRICCCLQFSTKNESLAHLNTYVNMDPCRLKRL
jgi:hypothetical protein